MKLIKSLQFASLLLVIALAFAAFVPAPTKAAPPDTPSIVDIALAVNADSGEFSTLIAAVVAADLVETLSGNRQFTVFAPTDAAFAELGLNAGTIGDLDKAELTDILLYHVAPGHRLSQSVVNAQQIRMLNKDFTHISTTEAGAFINDSMIVAVDIEARNGVIHVIDKVLLP